MGYHVTSTLRSQFVRVGETTRGMRIISDEVDPVVAFLQQISIDIPHPRAFVSDAVGAKGACSSTSKHTAVSLLNQQKSTRAHLRRKSGSLEPTITSGVNGTCRASNNILAFSSYFLRRGLPWCIERTCLRISARPHVL